MRAHGLSGVNPFIALLGAVFLVNQRQQEAGNQLQETTVRLEQMQGGNSEQNRQVVRNLAKKVRKHIEISGVDPTVAQIVDVN